MEDNYLKIKKINGNEKFQHVVIDILSEGIFMNDGVALLPLMNSKYYFVKLEKAESGFNTVEPDYVKFFYKIRKANRTSKNGNGKGKWINANLFSDRAPGQMGLIERVFIGGKIFPKMMLIYNNEFVGFSRESADTGKISINKINLNTATGKLISGSVHYDEFDSRFISIDNEKISVILPKINALGIDYVALMYDFLTNGSKTMVAASHGEFPSLEMYELATDRKQLQKGCWLTKDRKEGKVGNLTFQFACNYIIENKLQGVIAPFAQIHTFYEFVDQAIPKFKHKCRWTKGAKKLVGKLAQNLEGGSMLISNDVETILAELNLGICDYAITQFYELFNGKYATDPLDTYEKAYQFDKQFIIHEQGTVAVPIYEKTSAATIAKFQAMADKNISDGYYGIGGKTSSVTPQFDEPWKASVKDAGFRIDLPLLMLWLDRHQPTSATFKGKTYASDTYEIIKRKYKQGNKIIEKQEKEFRPKGTLKEEYRKIIRAYDPLKN